MLLRARSTALSWSGCKQSLQLAAKALRIAMSPTSRKPAIVYAMLSAKGLLVCLAALPPNPSGSPCDSMGVHWDIVSICYGCLQLLRNCGLLFLSCFAKQRVFTWLSKFVFGPFWDPIEIHMAFDGHLLWFFTCASQFWPSLPVLSKISIITFDF